jgi:hypothetical protein
MEERVFDRIVGTRVDGPVYRKGTCLHFLLNDKKELMHDNQLLKIAQLVNTKGIQFVASILKDKLPEELNREEYFVVKLSQAEKLFRIGD